MQVFLHRGQLHIIPEAEAELSAGDTGSPAVCDAVSYVRTNDSITVASALVQQALQHRISGYLLFSVLLHSW